MAKKIYNLRDSNTDKIKSSNIVYNNKTIDKIFDNIGTYLEQIYENVYCRANSGTNFGSLNLTKGCWVVSTHFCYEGTDLRCVLTNGKAQTSIYDPEGWVHGSVCSVVNVASDVETLVSGIWTNKNVNVSASMKAIKII